MRIRPEKVKWLLPFLALLLLTSACALSDGAAFTEDFSDTTAWQVSQGVGATGEVADGVFNFYVTQSGFYWIEAATAGHGPGTYAVTVSQAAGSEGVGYGLAFYVDPAQETFYLFEIGSDGFAWLGYCEKGCEVAEPLVETGWFETEAIRPGLYQPHRLRVDASDAGALTFYVDDQLIGTAQDTRLSRGDMALVVEAFAADDLVQVLFDDLSFTP